MAFNIYDIDKNGKVDKKEMEKVIASRNRKQNNGKIRRV